MSARVTPGPWFIDPDDRDGMEWNVHICSDEARDKRICFMANYENEHDASLIAAAPDLYQKVRAIARAERVWDRCKVAAIEAAAGI